MRILYEHREPARTRRKLALILVGALMIAALLAFPPEGVFTMWSLWALASGLQLLGVALLVLPPVIHIWITREEIILHPLGLRRRIPVQHIHDMILSGDGPEDDAELTLILHLRNGETVELTGWIGDLREVAALLDHLGVATRDDRSAGKRPDPGTGPS